MDQLLILPPLCEGNSSQASNPSIAPCTIPLQQLGGEELFKSFFENNACVMLLIEPLSGEIIEANRAAALYYGYPQNRLSGMPISQINTMAPQTLTEARQRALHHDRNYFLFDHQLASGDVRNVEVYATPITRRGCSLLLSIVHDITARKQAQAQLQIAAAAFDSQEAMLITDANSIILRVNRAYTDITGYSATDVLGKHPRQFNANHHDKAFYRDVWQSINSTGRWQGEIVERRKTGELYPAWLTISSVLDETGVASHYLATHFDISERKKAEEKINTLAFFDPLTGLPNRTLLQDRLKQAKVASARSDCYGALLMIDLDNFKTINDTLGHDIGDALLIQVAQRLKLCVREGDSVARLGGDEFVVVLSNLSPDKEDAARDTEAVAEKIIATLNPTYRFAHADHRSTASIGATLFKGTQSSIDELMKQADISMYKAKAAGRNTFCFFDPAMELAVKARAALESDLRLALEANQFSLHYQAQIAGDSRLIGAEALLRWQHPQRGLVSPADFIPLAEETGLILPLGLWVLETACAQLALWARQPLLADLTLAVNVSARQFHQRDFVAQVCAVLEQTGANPLRLKLELTESLLISNVEEVIVKMHALKALGISFSLDDFGTSYSSLAYLSRLPLDQLKIDRSFVMNLESDDNAAVICAATISLAHSLKLKVVAEGVETEAQRYFLQTVHRCDLIQGYLFSRPLARADFEAFAARAWATYCLTAST